MSALPRPVCYRCRGKLGENWKQTNHHGKWCFRCWIKEPGLNGEPVDRRASWE